MKSRLYLYGIILILSACCITACRKAGQWLEKSDDLVHADAMVILMGSIADRVLEAADQYQEGMTDRIIIVDEAMGSYRLLEARGVEIIRNTTQVNDILVRLGVPQDSITILPGEATSTRMEAEIIRDYLGDKPSTDTLLIVSSAYHTRRASMIFKAAFRDRKPETYLVFSPSSYSYFNRGKWWKGKEDIQVILSEYVKIISFVLFEKRHL